MGGEWNDEIAEAFENLENNNDTLDAFRTIIKQMKPFMYSFELREINGRTEKIPVQHKNSEYLLSALLGSMTSKLSKSPILRGLQKFMEDNDYDVVHFHSVVKEGFFNYADLTYDTQKFEKLHPKESYQDWRRKLDDKYRKGELSDAEYWKELSEIDYTREEDVIRDLENQTGSREGDIFTLNEEMVHTFPLDDLMIV